MSTVTADDGRRRRNIRTALVLLSIAAVFFAGVVLNRVFFG
ncbi:MAG: cytochrome oxidase small assembly protein [Lautropia sp.]